MRFTSKLAVRAAAFGVAAAAIIVPLAGTAGAHALSTAIAQVMLANAVGVDVRAVEKS